MAKKAAKRSTRSKPASRPASKGRAKSASSTAGTHTLHEDNPWTIDYAGHEPRKDSPLYVQSRKLLTEIAKSTETGGGPAWFYGEGPWEDHHGGGLWVHDGKGWFFLKNFAGIEWASQFCADPAKLERLRQNAMRLYQGDFLSHTQAEVQKLDPHYPFQQILTTPIRDQAGMGQWTDSIFNASVPLPKLRHTGVSPQGHGVHHYPTPVVDIELFKRDDFTLWVLDGEKQPAAVLPVHPRGADPSTEKHYGQVAVAYATPGTKLHAQLAKAHAKGNTLLADGKHPLAKQAFAQQS